MSQPLTRPKRKNPMVRTRAPVLPPWSRSRVALNFTAAAALGQLLFQQCTDCGRIQYPPREMCDGCLGEDLPWRPHSGAAQLLTETTLHHSHDLFFRERLPWRLGLVRLAGGPSVVAHVHRDIPKGRGPVRIVANLDRAGRGVLFALPAEDTPHMSDDPQYREMTCDPKFRKVLVTDGKTALGQAMVKAVIEAGASLVWVGHSEPWKKDPGFERIVEHPEVSLIPLDLTDSRNVEEQGAAIGGRVDILVNTAQVHRTQGISSRRGTDVARLEMDVNYFGLLRLAQAFGPAMKSRGADGQNSAVAWVNLLSVFALSNFPAHGTYSASQAAAYSLSQCLRTEFMPHAVRVMNVFPGPIDDDWNQQLPPPKLAPERLAAEVVAGLQRGVEDLYPGDVAQEWLTRFRENPKVLERELSEGQGT